jgi:AraC-like DNA-binding protein
MAPTTETLGAIALNPRSANEFGARHVILNGRTSSAMHVDAFTGPFSVKSVITGRATWETRDGRYVVTPGRHLVLNRGTRYALTIEGGAPVETFCVFFQDGFVEQALQSVTTSEGKLLDSGADRGESFAMLEAIHDSAQWAGAELAALHRMVQRAGVAPSALSGGIYQAALAVVNQSAAVLAMSRRLPATRMQTRRELVRRLHRAREYMTASFCRSSSLADIARASSLSPFHFHRAYRLFFGETPHQFVVRLRLDRAADRLRRTDRSVTEIALAVGFESPAHFSRAFKNRFQCSPQRYRQMFGR